MASATIKLFIVTIGLLVSSGDAFIIRQVPRDAETNSTSPCVESINQPFPSAYGKYRYAGVTCDAAGCSEVGTDIMLRQGGSATDAAIATMLCVAVKNLCYSGIGGGHISTIYDTPRKGTEKIMVTITGRERAPQLATDDMYVGGKASSLVGGKAIGIPGEIKGFHEAWKMFGRLKWSTLFEAAIRVCEQGFKIERALKRAMNNYESALKSDKNLREIFVKEDGTLLNEGDVLINAKLGQTMRRIAADPESFYSGDLARDIIADIEEYDGIMQLSDLEGYKAAIKPPLKLTLKNGDFTMYNPRPPASGAILSFIMSIVDGYNFGPDDVCDVDRTVLTYHRIVEAYKFAYAKRSKLGDEEFVDVAELVANLTSPEYAKSVRQMIDDTVTHDVSYYKPAFAELQDHGTTHMNVLGPDGSAVAMTSTINYYFGALVRGSRTGIIFNDEMDDFSTPGLINAFGLPPSPSNFIEPGKIPQSSTCPTIVLNKDGEVVFMAGGVGGSRITTTTAFVMMNSLWFKKDLKSATDTARIHHQLVPNILYYEPSLDSRIVAGLEAKKHVTSAVLSVTGMSMVNTVRSSCDRDVVDIGLEPALNTPLCVDAVSDGRRGGIPDGF